MERESRAARYSVVSAGHVIPLYADDTTVELCRTSERGGVRFLDSEKLEYRSCLKMAG